MKKIVIPFFLLISFAAYAQEIISPNKNIKVILEMKKTLNGLSKKFGQVYFKVLYKKGPGYVEVLPNSRLGVSRNDQLFVANLEFAGESKPIAIHDKYEMVCGKRKCSEKHHKAIYIKIVLL